MEDVDEFEDEDQIDEEWDEVLKNRDERQNDWLIRWRRREEQKSLSGQKRTKSYLCNK